MVLEKIPDVAEEVLKFRHVGPCYRTQHLTALHDQRAWHCLPATSVLRDA